MKSEYCCDRKSRAACSQSFALWQQATIEFMRRNHYIIVCSCHVLYILLFFAHIPFVFVVNHTINANGEFATSSKNIIKILNLAQI